MTLPAHPRRRLAAVACGLLLPAAVITAHAQAPVPADRVADRYRQLLATNPAEGIALDRLWQGAEERGTTAALLEDYRRAAAAGAFPAALVHGHLLKKAGRPDDAAAAYRRAAELDPASPLPALALAGLFTARGEPARAADAWEEALTKLPPADVRRRSDTLLALGTARQAAGDPTRATAAWEQAAALAPGDLALRERLATAAEAAGDFRRAAGHWEFIEAHAPAPEARALAARAVGRTRAAAGEFDPARDALLRGLALVGPGNWLRAEFQRALIVLHARASRLPELETRWRTDADRAPRDPGARLQLAEFYRQTGDRTGERTALEAVVALLPRAKEPALRLARLLADADDLPRAVTLLDGLLQAQPGNFDLLLARAELDLRTGRPDDAAARVENTVNAHPDDDPLRAAALTFFRTHRLTAATDRQLRAALDRRPDAEEPAFALATFLFQQHQPDAARAVLDGFLARAPAGADADRFSRAADLCRTHAAPADALRYARRAADAAPADAARRLALADLELTAGEIEAARRDFAAAADLAPDPEEAERRLFATFQPPPGADPETVRRAEAAAGEFSRTLETVAAREGRPPGAAARLVRWLLFRRQPAEALTVARLAAGTTPDSRPSRELLARAAAEAGDRALAIGTLERLAADDPTPAERARHRRTLAQLRQEEGDTAGALAILTELATAAPSRETLTDLALAQQRAERWEEARATWERLLALPGLPPGARMEARRPLIAVLGRLGQHARALELLDGALDAATTGDARAALFRDALALATEHDELLPRLAARAEGRVAAARPGDAAPLTELAAIRRQQGRERDADDLLERAALAATDLAASIAPLGALVDAAERRGDDDLAVARQERLVALAGPDAGAEALARQADLHGASGDPAGAARAWQGLAARFPRDPAGLTRAAAFFDGPEGDDEPRARELLARAAALDPGDLARQLRLGTLAAAAGDVPTARRAFDAVLERTPAEVPDELVELPEPLPPVGTAGVGSVSAAREERQQRLAAIRGLAGLPMSSPERARYLENWRNRAASAPGEALWAAHFADAPDLALDVLGNLALGNGKYGVDERLPRQFVVLALRAGDAGRLERFLRPEGGANEVLRRRRRDAVREGLRAFLPTVRDRERPVSDAVLAALFPESDTSRETLWRAAAGIFAGNGRFPEAVTLGERVLARSRSGRAAVAVALVRWQLWCSRPDAARAGLRAALDDPGTPSASSSRGLSALWGADGDTEEEATEEAGLAEGSDAGLEAVRLLHALLPEGERAAFRATMLARSAGLAPARAAEARLLLAGLAGDTAGARTAAARLVALRPTSGGSNGGGLATILSGSTAAGSETDARRWGYLLATVRRLADAGLDDAALALGAEALSDPGLVGLQGAAQREGPLRELRETVAGLRFRAAGGDLGREAAATSEFLRGGSPGPSAVNVANALIVSGLPAAAERLAAGVFPRLSPPVPVELRRARVRALLAAGNAGAAEILLRGALREASRTPPAGPDFAPAWTEIAVPLADLLEKAGDLPAACRLLANAPARQVGPSGVLAMRLAAGQEKLGDAAAAADTLRGTLRANPTLIPARLALADLEDRLGHPERAVAVLEEALPPATTPPAAPLAVALARRDLLAGRSDRPIELARRYVRAGQFPAAVSVAELLAGENVPPALRPPGRRLLAAVVHAGRDGQARFGAQRVLVERFCDPATDRADFDRELHRLGRFPLVTPGLRPAWQKARYDLMTTVHPELAGDLETVLRREDDAAGDARLIRLALRDREHPAADLPARVERLARRARVEVATLQEAVQTLDEGGRLDLAAALATRLAALLPQNADTAALAARARWQSGDCEGAAAALAAREALGALNGGEEPLRVASAWEQLGEPDRARAALARAAEGPPTPRPGAVRAALARLELARADVAAARPLLRAALADPTLTDLGPALDYLAARVTLADPAGWGEIAATVAARARLLPAAFDRLMDSGRFPEARALAASRPTLLRDYAPAATRLRTHAEESGDGDERRAVLALFEQAVNQTGEITSPRLAHEFARLLTVVAGALPPGDAQRLAHLGRAAALEPADGALARAVSAEYASRGDAAGATAVWQRLLSTPDVLPADREEARRQTGGR